MSNEDRGLTYADLLSELSGLHYGLEQLQKEWKRHADQSETPSSHLTEMGRMAVMIEAKTLRGCGEDIRALVERCDAD
jgi:hypothetical protein